MSPLSWDCHRSKRLEKQTRSRLLLELVLTGELQFSV
jgi:hypothetical protein